jgi:hypothetical protein
MNIWKFFRWMVDSILTGEPQWLTAEAEAALRRGQTRLAESYADEWLRRYG